MYHKKNTLHNSFPFFYDNFIKKKKNDEMEKHRREMKKKKSDCEITLLFFFLNPPINHLIQKKYSLEGNNKK